MNNATLPPLDGSTVRRVALLIVGILTLFVLPTEYGIDRRSPLR
jgi:hypothetical protein